jgi:hypothetical protein
MLSPRKGLLVAAVAMAVGLATAPAPARADLAICQKTVVKQLLKFSKIYLRKNVNCLNKDNKGDIGGADQCPDPVTALKIQDANSKVTAKIAEKCTFAELTTASPAGLGYRTDCMYGPATSGIEGDCASMPVSTQAEFSECMKCWKGADLAHFTALLYASHAVEFCGGSLDSSSPVCSQLECTAPLPEQRDLGDTGENDCQFRIAKAGTKYLLKRQSLLEKCLLKGCDRATCLAGTCVADPDVPLKLAQAETRKQDSIKDKCGNRTPSITSTFCCRCGPMGGTCTQVPMTREDCLAIDPTCKVQEGKLCNLEGGACEVAPKTITWWEFCPEDACSPGTPLADIDDLTACVDASADKKSDEMLCLQFPNSYPCATATPATTPTPTPSPTP